MSKVPVIIALVAMILIIIGGIQFFNYYANAIPDYKRTMGDLALNACDSATFPGKGGMIDYAQQFNQSLYDNFGIHDNVRHDSIYNSPWSWEQTPQNSMTFQQQYAGQMVLRAQYYQELVNNATIGLSKGSTAFTDILEKALQNYRAECNRNGPLDWVAENAYLMQKGNYFLPYYGGAFVVFGLLCFVPLILLDFSESDTVYEMRQK